MKSVIRVLRSRWFIAVSCLLIGALIILGIRFFTYKPDRVHYHANFAVYINGQREQFRNLKYYEETAAATCTAEPVSKEQNPMSRVHMHGMVNDVIHVEDHLVTWGSFFQALGWGLGDNYISTGSSMYAAAGQDKLTFILNGKTVSSVANRVIGDQDRLLVSYGDAASNELRQEYNVIQNKALKEDQSPDPVGCGGAEPITFRDRMAHLF